MTKEKIKASNTKGRISKKGKPFRATHNDRAFESKYDTHIDKEKSQNNIYLVVNLDGTITRLPENDSLEQHEMKQYSALYQDSLESKNERARAARHRNRIKSMEDYYRGRYTSPEEEILQIGKEGEFTDLGLFQNCVVDYIEEHQRKYPTIKILDAATHVDEMSIHCHLRKTYTAPDKEGHLEAKQHICLKNLGFELPEPEKERDRYNNLKVPYTRRTRDMWIDICERNLGIKFDRKPGPKRKRVETVEYKLLKRQEELEKVDRDIQEKKNLRNELVFDIEQKITYKEELADQVEVLADDVAKKWEESTNINKKLDGLRREQDCLERSKESIQLQIEAYETICQNAKEHKAPEIEIGKSEVKDGILRSHEEYFVRMPCKNEKEARKLVKELHALYSKHYTEKSFDEIFSMRAAADRKRKKEIARASERLQADKMKAVEESEAYKRVMSADLHISSAQLRGILQDAETKTLVEDTIDATISTLKELRQLPDRNSFTLQEKMKIERSVFDKLQDKVNGFIERVKDHMAKSEIKKYVSKSKGTDMDYPEI